MHLEIFGMLGWVLAWAFRAAVKIRLDKGQGGRKRQVVIERKSTSYSVEEKGSHLAFLLIQLCRC